MCLQAAKPNVMLYHDVCQIDRALNRPVSITIFTVLFPQSMTLYQRLDFCAHKLGVRLKLWSGEFEAVSCHTETARCPHSLLLVRHIRL